MSINGPKFGTRRDTDFTGSKSMTVQASKDDVDINKIVARILKGQSFPTVDGEPFYGDVSEFGGLQDAIIKAKEAEELFMQYPAEVRERFNNDPVDFVEFMEKPDNIPEAVKLGLVVVKPTPIVPPPAVIPPAV